MKLLNLRNFLVICFWLTINHTEVQSISFPIPSIIKSLFNAAVSNVENVIEDIMKIPPINDAVIFMCANSSSNTFVRVLLNDTDVGRKLNFQKPIGFLTHGWRGGINDTWLFTVGQLWSQNYDTNVCFMAWDNFSQTEYTYASQRNVPIVGGYLTQFSDFLRTVGNYQYSNITCVGHSLGAHVCSHLGRNSAGQLKKIVGLDPAGPLFTIPIKVDRAKRLDDTDAQQVIAIHTCDGVLGITYAIAHEDFYVNKGTWPQKGCMWPDLVETTHMDPVSCAHFRAVDMFRKSLAIGNKCVAEKCYSRVDYLEGRCEAATNYLGLNAANVPGEYFLQTEESPDCTGKF